MNYEWRRAIARRKVLLLIIVTVLFEVAPFIVFTTLREPTIQNFIRAFSDIAWLIGVLAPQGLFIHLTALLIAAGATAEEYEQGTVDMLLTKPLTRIEYLTGKFLGGFTLAGFVSLLLALLGIFLARVTFGPQQFLEYAPFVWLSSLYTILLFYSVGFMLGELYRRSGHALITGVSVLISSVVLTGILFFAFTLTQDEFYLSLTKVLPSWSTGNLPNMVATELFLKNRAISFLQFGPRIEGTIPEAAAYVLVYAVASIAITVARFLRSDIPRRTI